MDQLTEALHLARRTKRGDARLHLAALEGVRAAQDLELRDPRRTRTSRKPPTVAQVRRLKLNVKHAWAAYSEVRSAGLSTALRSLAGVREAILQLETALATQKRPPVPPVRVVIMDQFGDKLSEGEWPGELVPEGGVFAMAWPSNLSVEQSRNRYERNGSGP